MNQILLSLFLLFSIHSFGQENAYLKGVVTNGETDELIPYASIFLEKDLIGTVSNSSGEFELLIPENIKSDSLKISFLGFLEARVAIELGKSLKIKLYPQAIDLINITVRNHPPTFYIKKAMRLREFNYPQSPFSTRAYYSEIIAQNNDFYRFNECVFDTYYEQFIDTLPSQNQLLLFDERKTNKELEHVGLANGPDSNKPVVIDGMFGGPSMVLKHGKISIEDAFLDSTQFNKFIYTFSREEIDGMHIIGFSSKRYSDKLKSSGKIYIDMSSSAIVAIEQRGKIRIPFYAKGMLKLMGYKLYTPDVYLLKKFRQIDQTWFPDHIRLEMGFQMDKGSDSNKYIFQQIFSVNKIEVESPKEIEKLYLFNPKEELKNQVFNPEKVKWQEVNRIRE